MNSDTCFICESKHLIRIEYLNNDFKFLEEKGDDIFKYLNIHVCENCGFGFAYPFIDEDKLSMFYNKYYTAKGGPHYSFKKQYALKKKRKFDKYSISKRALAQLMLGSNFISLRKEVRSFLDIGASDGASFHTLRKLKCTPKCFAIEKGTHEISRLIANDIQVINEYDEHLTLGARYDNYFDLVLMSHVLEHFNANRIQGILRNIYKILNDRGIFICEVPSEDFKESGENRNNHAPHLSFFSKQSIDTIFKRLGFEILFVGNVGKPKAFNVESTFHRGFLSDFPVLRRFFKSLKKKYRIIAELDDYFRLYLLVELRKDAKYIRTLKKQDAIFDVLTDPNFQYSENGSLIRVCVRRALHSHSQ